MADICNRANYLNLWTMDQYLGLNGVNCICFFTNKTSILLKTLHLNGDSCSWYTYAMRHWGYHFFYLSKFWRLSVPNTLLITVTYVLNIYIWENVSYKQIYYPPISISYSQYINQSQVLHFAAESDYVILDSRYDI